LGCARCRPERWANTSLEIVAEACVRAASSGSIPTVPTKFIPPRMGFKV
jgi:hypothetical protein